MTENETNSCCKHDISIDEDDFEDKDDDGSDWDEFEDGKDDEINVQCLFCDDSFKNCDETFDHCKTKHKFSISKMKKQLNLDCFSYIRLVNYIRRNKANDFGEIELLRRAVTNDEYMKPVLEDDHLLMFDIEEVAEIEDDVDCGMSETVSQSRYSLVAKKLEETERQLKEAEDRLEFAMEQIAKMKDLVVRRLATEDSGVSDRSVNDSTGYFSSYAHFGIHHEMLRDEVRTTSYRDAMLRNTDLFDGKIVLDVGCGTSILSMFAARSGAARVFGVDQSEIIYKAMDIVRANQLEERVTLLKGRLEDVTIPIARVDAIVSEWMGYFLFFESMLDTVVYARDRYLRQGGVLVPNHCTINVAGISDVGAHAKLISFWDDVFGFKMSCFKQEVVQEATVEVVANDKLITRPVLVKDLDLMTCSSEAVHFAQQFQLEVTGDGQLTAIVAWFDIFFDLPNKVSFSTSPSSPTTHWKQTVFYLQNPMPVNNGSVINAKISCNRLLKDPRSLKITLALNEVHQSYVLQ